MNNDTTAAAYLQTIPSDVLAAAARGDLDLNAIARQELASRGLNWRARWVGFAAAARLAKAAPVRAGNGRIVSVIVPE